MQIQGNYEFNRPIRGGRERALRTALPVRVVPHGSGIRRLRFDIANVLHLGARKGHQLRGVSMVMTWLFTTLHGEFLVAPPRQHRFPHDNLEAVAAQLTPMTPVLADRSDSSQVLAALAKVDELYQAVVPLFYFEECPYKGIADILEMPIAP